MENDTATMENSMEAPQKIKNRVTIWPRKPSPGYLPEELQNIYLQRYMHTMFVAALFTVAKT